MVLVQFPSATGEKPKLQESQTNTQTVGSGEAWQYDNLTANASISPKLCYAFGTLYAVWAEGSALWFAKSRDAGQSWEKKVIYTGTYTLSKLDFKIYEFTLVVVLEENFTKWALRGLSCWEWFIRQMQDYKSILHFSETAREPNYRPQSSSLSELPIIPDFIDINLQFSEFAREHFDWDFAEIYFTSPPNFDLLSFNAIQIEVWE
ncbi:MAG: hypothetical protein QW620_08400 [Thermoplasmata archaeon]